MASSFPIRLGLEDAFAKANNEEETTTSNNESMFEDEIIPTAAPPSSQRSFDTRQFDPFAPTTQGTAPMGGSPTNLGGDSGTMERFEDEVVPVITTTPAPSSSPILMPMNPEADADLLGGTTLIPKHPSKATKDAKITNITYQDGDDLLTGFPQNPPNTKAGDENSADKFVDDEAGPGGASNGGFFSRIRNPFTRNADPAANGETQEPTTDPSPSTQFVGGLDYGGNSLPHPESLKPGSTRDFMEEIDNESKGGLLDENGNSLPHPDEVMPGSTRDFIEESDNESQSGLDKNGNSLPHPDQVMPGSTRDFVEENDNDSQGGLDENGNSLPHPEEIPRLWGRSARKSGEDILDTNGNSLPHPDSVKAQEDNERVLLNETLRMSDASASSDPALDRQRLIEALAESGSVEENDAYYGNSTDDDDYDDEDDQELSSNRMMPDGSGRGLSSFRLGNLKMSLRSTFKKAEDKDANKRAERGVGGDEFWDEEADRTESLTHTDADFLDVDTTGFSAPHSFATLPPPSFDNLEENGNLLQGTAALDDHRRKSTLQSLRQGITNALKPRSSLPNATPVNDKDNENSSSSNLFLPANGDEESAYVAPIVHPIEIDGFDDESKNSRHNLTRKERVKKMLIKHYNSPKSRRICLLVTALFLIFLGLIIPLSYLARERRQGIRNGDDPPMVTLAPTSAPTPEIVCEDEIVLTDSDGKDLDLDADENGGEPRVCLTTKDPIHFRFKRCRPASPLDWVGIFAEGSVFLGRLWENYVDGTYLCGGQPCPIDDPDNKKDDPPRAAMMKAPPIQKPGYYRLFLVEDSPWPYDYSKYTPSFRVVEDEKFCPSGDDSATLAPTLSGTFSGTTSGTTSGTRSTLSFGTVTPTDGSTDSLFV
jgi:hypothetical protein